MSRLASLLLIFLFGLTEALAQGEETNELKECASVTNDLARLACFDALAAQSGKQGTASLTQVESQAGVTTEIKQEQRQLEPEPPEPEIEQQAESQTGVTTEVDQEQRQVALDPAEPAIEQSETPESQFGFPESTPEKSEKTVPEAVIAHVTTFARLNRSNNIRVSLDNGQVWQEIDGKPFRGNVEIGTEVTITKRRFGGYRMSVPGRSSSILVRRIK